MEHMFRGLIQYKKKEKLKLKKILMKILVFFITTHFISLGINLKFKKTLYKIF